ncbi:hypothetical protein TRFO_25172 [Tritrichomonas foetus]|uniref:Uncharacterized protein n=1 Tax=Tritrichomonas foetus TaxID=1144522 RepID=A0A1J4K5N3_9EUKA|nr:hypothetical protein TRFO_25172 [Tritrichomonas foetus]|eukprot:OHT06711.1 hypothetical protein TRFO_25172 [Tritrichomonas foetus]
MYRAIPEVNRICAMADRSRRYRLHQEALLKLKAKPGNANPKAKSALQQTKVVRPYSLRGKAQKEEQERITYENKKIMKAICNLDPTINRAEFYEHEIDHKHQVSRMSNVNKCGFEMKENIPPKAKNPKMNHNIKSINPIGKNNSLPNIDQKTEKLLDSQSDSYVHSSETEESEQVI